MNVAMPPVSDDPPSHRRPFVLRGVAPRPTVGPAGAVRAKHRTPATQRKIPEVLTAYSHSAQAADLRLCHTTALTSPDCAPETECEASVEPADAVS
jgi:hypothetical protein